MIYTKAITWKKISLIAFKIALMPLDCHFKIKGIFTTNKNNFIADDFKFLKIYVHYILNILRKSK